ncbi:hypothetical protein ACIGN6_17110 [Streptomyces sp. NPDC053792]|uniref:hypothetical protein n=1 Tax=unclassified Streptomyces TaxID=2593676 RepID=UPI003425A0B9
MPAGRDGQIRADRSRAGCEGAREKKRRPQRKAAGKRGLDSMARRLLLLRQAMLADRRAYATEPEHLRDAATVTRVEYVLDHAAALQP